MSRRQAALVAHVVVSAVLSGVTLVGAAEFPVGPALVWWDCLMLSLISIWLVVSWRFARGSLFNPYGLFLFSTLAFNAGQVPLQVFGLNDNGLLRGQFTAYELHASLLFIGACLIGLQLGALLRLQLSGAPLTDGGSVRGVAGDAAACRRVGLVMLCVGAVPAFIVLTRSVGLANLGGYIAIYAQQASTSFDAAPQVLASFLLPGAFFLLAGSERARRWVYLSGAIVIVYMSLHLYIGDRANAFLPVIAWLWIYTNVVRRLPGRLLLIGAIVTVIVIFPVVGQLRNLTASGRVELGVVAAFQSVNNPVLATVSETGGSMETVVATMILIPERRPFDVGVGYAYALLTIVPNLFWAVHPSIAHGSYDDWLVAVFAPTVAAAHGGLGFSYLAEAYANFGWLGFTIPFILGFMVVWLEDWARGRGVNSRYAAVGACLPALLFWARAEASFEIRTFIWYAAIPFFAVMLLSRRSRRVDRIAVEALQSSRSSVGPGI